LVNLGVYQLIRKEFLTFGINEVGFGFGVVFEEVGHDTGVEDVI
jgi:hypothetical protein